MEIFGTSNFAGPTEPYIGQQNQAGADSWSFSWVGAGEASFSDDPFGVGKNQDGRVEVFARSSNQGAVWHIWQTVDGNWSNWTSLGGSINGGPAVASNKDGRIEVFVRGGDSALYHIWQTAPGGSWSPWASLGGKLNGAPAVAANADGRLEVFARGGDNSLCHIWQTTPNGGWSAWSDLGGNLDGNYGPAVAANYDGRLEVFAWIITSLGEAVGRNVQLPGGGWSGWEAINLLQAAMRKGPQPRHH